MLLLWILDHGDPPHFAWKAPLKSLFVSHLLLIKSKENGTIAYSKGAFKTDSSTSQKCLPIRDAAALAAHRFQELIDHIRYTPGEPYNTGGPPKEFSNPES